MVTIPSWKNKKQGNSWLGLTIQPVVTIQQTILTSRLQYNESYKNNKTFLFDNCTELLLQK